jgi:hypothetical protein
MDRETISAAVLDRDRDRGVAIDRTAGCDAMPRMTAQSFNRLADPVPARRRERERDLL